MLEKIPHFATVSYAFRRRFPPELSEEIFAHILNKALNNKVVEPSMAFIDGTHIKASANKKKFQKEQAAKTAKVYARQLRRTALGMEIYSLRKETIERVFADAKDKHGMRFTHRRGLARFSSWVRLKFAALDLKKLAPWWACHSFLHPLSLGILSFFLPFLQTNGCSFDRQFL